MTPSEAQIARAQGVRRTAEQWIREAEETWRKALASGRDTCYITNLNLEVIEVQNLVVKHFRNLGYGFEIESYHGGDYRDYCLRMSPLPPKEPGLLSQFLTRLFGGQHA